MKRNLKEFTTKDCEDPAKKNNPLLTFKKCTKCGRISGFINEKQLLNKVSIEEEKDEC